MNARRMLQMGEAAVGALETIEELTKLGGPKAEAALAGIRAVLHALNEGFAGELSPQAVLLQIGMLQQQIADNDAAALAELQRRFGAK